MKELLLNKKVLIAGAGGLLGSHLVVKLIEQGASVIAADIDIDKTKALLVDLGIDSNFTSIAFEKLDITSEEAVRSFFRNDIKIDGAVNCTYPRNKSYGSHFFDVTLDSFNDNLALHLGSAFIFSQQCAAYYLKNKASFSLVNISSIYGVVAPNFNIYENTAMTMPVEYSAIKSALLHLNKYIVKYVNESDFRINSVSPGGIFDHQPEAFLKAYKKETHGKGMLNVQSILGAIVFLLSDHSEYTVGQNIIVDDGFSL
tara:strand:- start:13179 stop:13949 length:771 start_codon:yes stop_codon:yes gene_type:complete